MVEWHSFSDAVVREDSEPLTYKRVDVTIVFLGASSQHPWFESLFTLKFFGRGGSSAVHLHIRIAKTLHVIFHL